MKKIIPIIFLVVLAGCANLSKYKPVGIKDKKQSFTTAWSKNLDPSYQTGNLPISLNSPLIHDGLVYIGNNNGTMDAYQIDNGRLVWRTQDKGTYHGAPIAVGDNLIYGTTEGRLYSRDLFTGKIKYSVDLGASIESRPTYYKGRIFLHLRNHKIIALDAITGKILWSYRRSISFLTTVQRVSEPKVFNNKLYVGFADGYVATFSIEEGMLLWERKISRGNKFIDVDATPVFFGGNLVISSLAGDIMVLNPNTGALLRKIQKTSGRSAYVNGDFIAFGTSDGEFILYDKNFTLIVSKKVANAAISNISFWKNKYIYSSIDGHVGVLSKDKFVLENEVYLGHSSSSVFGSITKNDDYLAFFSSRNRLYVYR